MQLERCGAQRSGALDEYYAKLTTHDTEVDRSCGATMLDLIGRLRGLDKPNRAWGLTSVHRLCLLAQDDWKSPWYVIVSALDRRNYWIEYLLPQDLAPWPDSYVRREARSEDEALHMIVAAIEKSGGWSALPEP